MVARCLMILAALLVAAPAQALHDHAPDPTLAAVEGEWRGSLTYRDYSPPHDLVRLPTRLLVALGAHDELVMHYVYDDGPGKTVHSYESVRFEFAEKRVTWATRGDEGKVSVGRIISDGLEGAAHRVVVETTGDDGAARHTFEFARDHVAMKKEERDAHGTLTLRNEYAFTRP